MPGLLWGDIFICTSRKYYRHGQHVQSMRLRKARARPTNWISDNIRLFWHHHYQQLCIPIYLFIFFQNCCSTSLQCIEGNILEIFWMGLKVCLLYLTFRTLIGQINIDSLWSEANYSWLKDMSMRCLSLHLILYITRKNSLSGTVKYLGHWEIIVIIECFT